MRRLSCLSVILVAGFGIGGCDSATGNKEPKVTLTTSGSTASIGQGQSTTISVFVARSNFDKTVVLTVTGAPAGVSAIVTPGNIEAGTPSSTLLVSADASAEPGTSTLTVHATGDGITEQTIPISVTVTVTGDFTLAALDPSVTVAQGGGGTNTVQIARTQSNASNVTLVASGVPTGITATFSSSPTTTKSSLVTLTATGGAVPGTYTVTVTGSATGLANQVATFTLAVIAPPATAALAIPFCADGVPVWFAYRNEGYNWQQVTPSGTTFNFNATSRLAVAYAFGTTGDTQLNIFHLTRAEFSASTDRDCSGPKSFTGSVAGLAAGQAYKVVMGAESASGTSFSPTFSLAQVASRPLDLVATRGTASGAYLTPDKLIVRRALDLATGSAIPVLDFSAAEAFAPDATNLTIQGLQTGDVTELQNTLWTATSTFGTAHSAQVAGGTTTLYSAPAAQLIAGDLHELYVDASQSSSSLVVGRSYVEYFTAAADRTIQLGPTVPIPTISAAVTSPYARMRGQVTAQPEYDTFVDFAFVQTAISGQDHVVVLGTSAGYLGATPGTWDMTIPDFTGTAGFNASWMPVANQTTVYVVEGYSGKTQLLFGALPAQGDVVRIGYRAALTTSSVLAKLRAGQRAAGRNLPQYLRR